MKTPIALARWILRAAPLWMLGVGAGCGNSVYLGSDLIWSARLEGGDLSEWSADPVRFASAADSANVHVSDARARQGRYSLSITRPPSDTEGGPVLGHAAGLPPEAYYAAWLYIPDNYPVTTYWAVLQLRSIGTATEPDRLVDGAELRLRRLPGGQLILYVFQHEAELLQAPLTDPPALVPVGQWFQIEVFFRLAADSSGTIRVWLDGRLVYDLPARATGAGQHPWFGVSSASADSGATSLTLFADDMSASYSRATPDELLDQP